MSARADDDRRIAEIWVATRQLKRKLVASGLTRESFVTPTSDLEQLLVDGLYHGLERIVEECRGLSFHMKSCYPDVPWDQIGGMRDRLVHDSRKQTTGSASGPPIGFTINEPFVISTSL